MDSEASFKNSVLQVVSSIPLTVRSAYHTALPDFYDKAFKTLQLGYQVISLEGLKNTGQYVAPLNSIRQPTLQLSEEFLSSGKKNALEDWNKIASCVIKCKNDVFQYYINSKINEETWMKRRYTEGAAIKELALATLNSSANTCLRTYGVAELKLLPKEVQADLEKLNKDPEAPFRLVLGIADGRCFRLYELKNKKKAARQETDVMVTDTKDMQKTIQQGIEAYLSRKKQSQKDKAKNQKNGNGPVSKGRKRRNDSVQRQSNKKSKK